ncbi:putative Ig domain-containing protein [Pelagicoccus sp. SDUM812005]|uniref:putative Ig domain-containing protein n=1 Tax=Pelagicoccus sp. SDUM812005 TaxID=3041257 RepID=UPI00281049B9|nr:putative Ig domain-containing protein [Pelagicoccus sp. SDUM812005]MDQ8183554.1 putative Ig domain-containing protein [Pelagicoccus sp. SDUM812005]
MNIGRTTPFATLRALCSFAAVVLLAKLGYSQTVLTEGEVDAAYSYQWAISPAPEEGSTWAAVNLPDGLSINSTTALISGVPTTVGVYDQGRITLTRPDLTTDNFDISITIVAASGTPEITSATTASGTVGEAFNYVITANNSPQSFNVSGDLPAGVTFSSESLSGTPTEAGTFTIALSANNASGTGAETTLTLTIDPAGAVPVISSASSLSGDADELLSYQITASESPTSYSASGLPPGMTINTETGFINGKTSIENVYTVDLTATNEHGTSAVFKLTIVIGAVPQISSSLAISAEEDTEIDAYQLSASNSPTSFTVSTDSLPAGLSYSSSTKRITGTPTEVGTFNVDAYASNAIGDGPTSTIVITVEAKVVTPVLRSASFNVEHQTDGSLKLFLVFEQSADDLTNYDWLIETSTDLETWTQIDIDDAALSVTITENQDGSKSVSVLYPNFDSSTTQAYFRYRVQAKSGQ